MTIMPKRRDVLVASSLLLARSAAAARPPSRALLVCGAEEVFIFDMNAKPPRKVWTWRASDRRELPREMHAKFRFTDDCKPVDGGKRVLITSSADGVALVERPSGKVVFSGSVGGAHSACLLPRGRIVVAGSSGATARANTLTVFDVNQSGRPVFHLEFPSAHGLVWDAGRQRLWATGGAQLRSYRLANWDGPTPWLERDEEHALPDHSGHDLMPVPGTDLLAVTTLKHAWLFDRAAKTFAPHPKLRDHENVKSLNVHPVTGQIAYTEADKGVWWTQTIRFTDPDETLPVPGARFYKVRWLAG